MNPVGWVLAGGRSSGNSSLDTSAESLQVGGVETWLRLVEHCIHELFTLRSGRGRPSGSDSKRIGGPRQGISVNISVLVRSSHWDEMIVARRFIAGKAYPLDF